MLHTCLILLSLFETAMRISMPTLRCGGALLKARACMADVLPLPPYCTTLRRICDLCSNLQLSSDIQTFVSPSSSRRKQYAPDHMLVKCTQTARLQEACRRTMKLSSLDLLLAGLPCHETV